VLRVVFVLRSIEAYPSFFDFRAVHVGPRGLTKQKKEREEIGGGKGEEERRKQTKKTRERGKQGRGRRIIRKSKMDNKKTVGRLLKQSFLGQQYR